MCRVAGPFPGPWTWAAAGAGPSPAGLSWNSDPVSLFRNDQGTGERKERFQKVSAVAPCVRAAGLREAP